MDFAFVILCAMAHHNVKRFITKATRTKIIRLFFVAAPFILILFISACATQVASSEQANLPTLAATAVLPTITTSPTPSQTPTQTNTPLPTNTVPPTETQVWPTITPADTAVPTNTPAPTLTPTNPPPLPTPRDVYSWTLQVPILMYHYVSIPPEGADKYRINLSVPPETFRAQMQYLADNGYTTVDLYDLSRAITDKQELPAKPIILTFDDGYLDNYQNAYPILEEFGFKGTFFIPTEFIDFGREGYMNWEQIEEMAANGHRMEPHSRTHPDLRDRRHEFLIWEILGPIETLEAHIGYKPRYFSYPAGQYDEKVINILRELDMWGAVTTMGGTWHGFEDRFEWTRVRVAYGHSMQDFIDRVELKDTVGGKKINE